MKSFFHSPARALTATVIAIFTMAFACRAQIMADAWVKPPVTAERLQQRTFDSAAAKAKVSFLIYTPAEYDTATNARFPVLYWLHGVGGGQQGVADMVRRFDAAIHAGKTPPMLVVFVNGLTESMWCDSKDGKAPVETVFIKELIPQVDASFRTIAAREGRIIEGFSMGGFGAARLGFKYPETFGAVSMLAGALHNETTLQQRRSSIFKNIFSGDVEYFKAQSPWTLAEQSVAGKARLKIRQVVGDRDQTLAYNRNFDAHLTRLGIAHEFTVLPGIGHTPNPLYDALGEANWKFYREVFGQVERGVHAASPSEGTDAHPNNSATNNFAASKRAEARAPGAARNSVAAVPRSRDGRQRRMQQRVESQGIQSGDGVTDAEVFTLDGKAVRLSSLWRDKPLVLVTASLTCPVSVRECPSLAELKAKHDPRANFAVLYVKEAHPAASDQPVRAPSRDGGAVASGVGAATQPATLAERLKLASAFARNFSGDAPVYVADIGNELAQRLGTGPNTGLLIHTNGVLKLKQGWFKASEMSEAVGKLLGEPAPAKSRMP